MKALIFALCVALVELGTLCAYAGEPQKPHVPICTTEYVLGGVIITCK